MNLIDKNGIIDTWHSFGDYALLRRMLYDKYLIDRSPDGREYRKSAGGEHNGGN